MCLRKIFSALIILSCLTPAFADYVPGVILVKFQPEVVGMSANIKATSVRVLATKLGVTKMVRIFAAALKERPERIELADYYKVYLPKGKQVEDAVKEFKSDPNVIYAQPNYIYHTFNTKPNDPEYSKQWGLPKMSAESAWDIYRGTSETLVAVIDTGIDYLHPDLAGKVNTAEGIAFRDGVVSKDTMDGAGHGTSVAGVIAANTSNEVGIAGTNWYAKLLPIKAMYKNGNKTTGDTADIIAGIDWAVIHEAKVINMSLGQTKVDQALEEACKKAYDAGVVLVAAAGNDGQDEQNYPAAYDSVICVAATDQNDIISDWTSIGGVGSNYGSWVDVSAPGTDIRTTQWSGSKAGPYFDSDGTSLATPFVAGVAALLKGRSPQLTPAQIMFRIQLGVDDIYGKNLPYYAGKLGTGRVNMYKALTALIAKISSPASGEYLRGGITVKGTAQALLFSSYEVDALKNGDTVEVASSESSVEAGILATWNTAGLDGNYSLRLKVYSAPGPSTEVTVPIIVDNTAPEVAITSPESGASLEGIVLINGTAKDANFNYYVVDYGAGSHPTSFQTIVTKYNQVDGNTLASWETTGLQGDYTLRLSAWDLAGNTASTSEVVALSGGSVREKKVEAMGSLSPTFVLPNPFTRSTTTETMFVYNLSGNFATTIFLFDLNGNLIWRKNYAAGDNGGKASRNTPGWSGVDLYGATVDNGVYLYQVVADQKVIARGKLVVIP